MGNKPLLLQLDAAVRAENIRGIREELRKIIPQPHEHLNVQTLQALLDIIKDTSPQVAGYFLRTFTQYLKKLGYAHESIYYFALQCAEVYKNNPQQLITAFNILMRVTPDVNQYKDRFKSG